MERGGYQSLGLFWQGHHSAKKSGVPRDITKGPCLERQALEFQCPRCEPPAPSMLQVHKAHSCLAGEMFPQSPPRAGHPLLTAKERRQTQQASTMTEAPRNLGEATAGGLEKSFWRK